MFRSIYTVVYVIGSVLLLVNGKFFIFLLVALGGLICGNFLFGSDWVGELPQKTHKSHDYSDWEGYNTSENKATAVSKPVAVPDNTINSQPDFANFANYEEVAEPDDGLAAEYMSLYSEVQPYPTNFGDKLYVEAEKDVKKGFAMPAEDKPIKPVRKNTSYSTNSDNYATKKFVKVRFGKEKYASDGHGGLIYNQEYDYLCDIPDVKIGDYVMVPAGNKIKKAEVTGVIYRSFSEMPLPASKYKKVIEVVSGYKAAKAQNSYRTSHRRNVQTYEEKRCVSVIFETDGNEYNYLCEDETIGVDDFVIVKARGEEAIAKVTEVYEEVAPRWRPIVRAAYGYEIDEAEERFDEFYHFREADREYEEEEEALRELDSAIRKLGESADELRITLDSVNTSSYDDDDDYDFSFSHKNDSMIDERGYMRNGTAEYYEEQLEKAKKLGRTTDDRGFTIDPYYAERLRDNFANDDLYDTHGDD